MKAYKLVFDQSTFGITGKSLKMLRNALVDNMKDEIVVLKIPTDEILCGFLLLNKSQNSATWSGDGFRTDKGGEGGRGYKAALQLLETFGVRVLNIYTSETIEMFKQAINIQTSDAELGQQLLKASNLAADEISEKEYQKLYELTPSY